MTATYEGVRHLKFWKRSEQKRWPNQIVVEIRLGFEIVNVSRQACYNWAFDWDLTIRPQNHVILDAGSFDGFLPTLRETQDEVILPSRKIRKVISIGVPLTMADEKQGIWWPLQDTHIAYRAISEHHVPEFRAGPIARNSDHWLLGDQFKLELEEF